jgi:ABC-type Na+ transport system ATPase subunit NatA
MAWSSPPDDWDATRVPGLLAYHVSVVSPLLASSSLRVDVAGMPAIDGLTLESTGKAVLVLGAPRALFEAAAGLRVIEHGGLLVAGMSPPSSSRSGVAAAAPLDPPMPPRWTVLQYMSWSARLSGLARAECERAVHEALERLQLFAHRSLRLGKASFAVRRGAVIGAALATRPRVLLVEDPTVGLSGDTEPSFARVVARVMRDQPTLLFAGRVALDSPVALAADEAIVVDGSKVLAQGALTEVAVQSNSFSVWAAGDVESLTKALTASGCRLQSSETSADAARFTVDLGSLGTCDLLRVAEASSAIVLELRPLTRVFA